MVAVGEEALGAEQVAAVSLDAVPDRLGQADGTGLFGAAPAGSAWGGHRGHRGRRGAVRPCSHCRREVDQPLATEAWAASTSSQIQVESIVDSESIMSRFSGEGAQKGLGLR